MSDYHEYSICTQQRILFPRSEELFHTGYLYAKTFVRTMTCVSQYIRDDSKRDRCTRNAVHKIIETKAVNLGDL